MLLLYRYNSTGLSTADQIRLGQQEIIDQQDEGLEHLSKALRNQQRMGHDMQDEIQEQNGGQVSASV